MASQQDGNVLVLPPSSSSPEDVETEIIPPSKLLPLNHHRSSSKASKPNVSSDSSSQGSCSLEEEEEEELFEDALEEEEKNKGNGQTSSLPLPVAPKVNRSTSSDSGHSSRTSEADEEEEETEVEVDEIKTEVEDSGVIVELEDPANRPSLEDSIDEIVHALSIALDNRFNDALRIASKWSHCSLYHALGRGTLSFLKGCLTLERQEIRNAIDDLQNCVDVCTRARRSSSMLSRVVWRPNYNSFTDEEIHAELIYAEALFMTALLTFLADQSLLNLVRGAFRIRTSFQTYKECMHILDVRTEWSSEHSRRHFESGARLGIGAFNVILSHLPGRVIKLLEFVGFSGNHQQGIRELNHCAEQTQGLRCPFAILVILSYQTYVEHIFGLGEWDQEGVAKILDYALGEHPNGAFFLLFLGRQKMLTGKVDEAVGAFEKCLLAQNEWRQFHNICHWELLWCHANKCDWTKAAECANTLRTQCRWSPGAYTYQYATLLYMIRVEENRPELDEEIGRMLSKVPALRVRFAGKTVPAEKMALLQAQKYFDHNHRLCLPAIEFMYLWNQFTIIGQSETLIQPILDRIQSTLNEEERKLSTEDGAEMEGEEECLDDYARCLLLKGMCLRYLKRVEESNECFHKIIEVKPRIERDTYLVPQATLELGLNYMWSGDHKQARQWMEEAKTYSGYALETIVHFRIHTAHRLMSKARKAEAKQAKQEAAAATLEQSPQPSGGGGGSSGGLKSIWSELSRRLTMSNGNSTADVVVEENEEEVLKRAEAELTGEDEHSVNNN